MTIQSQLDQVLALAEKATPVTWSACERGFGDADLWFTPYEAWSDYDGKLARGQLTLEDAQFIAAAVNFLREHGPAIRAATVDVGALWELEASWRQKSRNLFDEASDLEDCNKRSFMQARAYEFKNRADELAALIGEKA